MTESMAQTLLRTTTIGLGKDPKVTDGHVTATKAPNENPIQLASHEVPVAETKPTAEAQRIRQLALENSIPVVERKPLAQALYKEVEINHPIPNQMYAGVAEVLAYVYQLKGKTMPKVPGM